MLCCAVLVTAYNCPPPLLPLPSRRLCQQDPVTLPIAQATNQLRQLKLGVLYVAVCPLPQELNEPPTASTVLKSLPL